MEEIKAYKKIIKIIDDYDLKDMYNTKLLCDKHIYHNELKEKYGLDIPFYKIEQGSRDWFPIEDWKGNVSIGKWGEKYNRTILNSREQPTDEILLCIGFPTGAYVFGEDYPTELFGKFFEELKSYKPKYIDEINNYLYFTLDNSKEIYSKYDEIFKKYSKMYIESFNDRRIEELKEEIKRLEKEEI